jgi:hypothetical protein
VILTGESVSSSSRRRINQAQSVLVIETKLMGRRLGLSTLIAFLSLIFWGSLLGPVGMVLCIPLTMTLKFACEGNKGTRWIAVLLGPRHRLKAFHRVQERQKPGPMAMSELWREK